MRDDNGALRQSRTQRFRNKETTKYNLERRIGAAGEFLGQLPKCGGTSSPGKGRGRLWGKGEAQTYTGGGHTGDTSCGGGKKS